MPEPAGIDHTRPRVGARWFSLFTLGWLVIWMAQLTPLQLLIPLQLRVADDAEGWVGGVVGSGLVLSVGGVAGLVAGPLTGALSDRTRGRFGRRRPWALVGVGIGTLSLVAASATEGPWGVGAAWVGVSVGIAVASAAFTAMIADQLPPRQRGAASAAVGSAQAVGIVLGVGVVVLLGLGTGGGYLTLAAVFAIGGTLAALLLPDPPGETAGAGSAGLRLLGPLLRDGAMRNLLAGRLVGNVGNALGTALLLYFLLYGLGQNAVDAEENLLLLIVVYTVFVVGASVVAGAVTDRRGFRREVTAYSTLLQAAAGLLLLALPSFGSALVAGALLGAGYGVFTAGGLALATDLLRRDGDHAHDLGVVNVAANLGQLLGPVLGAGLVAAVGSFWLLFLVSALCSLAGGILTLAARSEAADVRA